MTVVDNSLVAQILRFPSFLLTLFFSRKFIVHRVAGLLYLLQFFAALWFYFADYNYFYNSILIWSLPFTGFLQSIIASCTFTFLPKKQDDPGYYGDKSVLSHNFVMENIYFSGLLLFQWCYMHKDFNTILFNDHLRHGIEIIFCFLPYIVIRPFFPKTSFRDSLGKSEKNKTETNRSFFIIVTWVTKIFYVWAKHFIGFFLNYARYLDRISPVYIHHIYLMLIMSSSATTISMFLHTLKFKKIIGPRTAYIIYMISYLSTFYSWVLIVNIFFQSPDLLGLTCVGVLVNFSPNMVQIAYQGGLAVMFHAFREHLLPLEISKYVFSA